MRIVEKSAVPEWATQGAYTIENFSTLFGRQVDLMPQIVKLRPNYTMNFITDGLKRKFISDNKSTSEKSKYLAVEWILSQRNIPRIKIIEACTDTGINKTPISLILEEPYYSIYDVFALENQQQLRVMSAPRKLSANRWEYTCVIEGASYDRGVIAKYVAKGKTTIFRTNYYPELSDRGSDKYMESTERHRIYISRHRVARALSGDYASMYVEMKSKGKIGYFEISEPEQDLMDQLLFITENSRVFGESNHDINGKVADQDSQGRDLPSGDGVLRQIERYCDKINYAVLTTDIFDAGLDSVVSKTEKRKGNHITVACNYEGYRQAQRAMKESLRETSIDGAWYYDKTGKHKVSVGQEYEMYHYNGNHITFVIDDVLSENILDRGYLIFLDTTVNNGMPNVVSYTLEGREYITGILPGMGGKTGRASGQIATALDGTEIHMLTYSGIAVKNPYAGFIMQENLYD